MTTRTSSRTSTRTSTRTSSRTGRTAQPPAGTARAYGEAVLVRGGLPGDSSDGPPWESSGRPLTGGPRPPSQFLWQGRLYVIRRVLAHWYEREAWWAQGPALSRRPGSPKRLRDLAVDREIWRVEASSGRQSGSGVYDLCRLPAEAGEPGLPGGAAENHAAENHATEDRSWRLLRVSD